MVAASSASDLPRIVLLIVTDQFRQDAFDPNITPHLHRLSQTSTVFSNAYVSTPTCTPSRAALLTGKSPWNHGMLGYGAAVNCEEYPTTLPSVLDGMGYRTVVAGKNHFGVRHNGDDDDDDDDVEFITHGYEDIKLYEGLIENTLNSRGPNTRTLLPDDYDKFFNSSLPGVDPLSTCNLGWNGWESCPYEFDEYFHPTSWTTRTALDYIDSFFDIEEDADGDDKARLFLKVSYHRPHSPYDPPKRLWDKHMSQKHGDKYRRNVDNHSWDQEYLNTTEMPPGAFHGDPGDEKARQSRAAYYANVELVDEGIGSILSALEEKNGVLKNDIFIVWTSDHGDMNGDHNLWRKGYPWEGASHVNMMMKMPNQSVGTISGAIVETRDVAPTIYDLLGTLQDVTSRDPLINGKSLLPILEGKSRSVRDHLDLEHSIVYDKRIHWNALVGNLGDKLYKYVFFADGREQLFSLSDDPNERKDLSGDGKYESIVQYWRKAMARQFKKEGRGDKWVAKNGTLVAGRDAISFGPNYPCPVHKPADVGKGLAIE